VLVISRELRRVADQDIELVTMRRVSFRLLPFILLLYIFCWFDRSNISIAALQMNSDLKFSSAVFGFGAGIFFLSYSLFEIPSNLILRSRRCSSLARAHRDYLGVARMLDDVGTNPATVLRSAVPSRNGGGRVLSWSHLLS
jgi:hypothetical protein